MYDLCDENHCTREGSRGLTVTLNGVTVAILLCESHFDIAEPRTAR